MNTGFLLKTLQGLRRHVISPAVEVEGFVFGLSLESHGQQQRGETQLEHGSHDEHLTGGSGIRMRRRIH